MPIYLPDTNILIDFRRDPAVFPKLKEAQKNGKEFRIAPPVLIEFVRGFVRHGAATFEEDKKVFEWLLGQKVMELPCPFIAQTVGCTAERHSGVEPTHYSELIKMAVSSADIEEFVRTGEAAGSVWNEISRADEIHDAEVDKEIGALEKLARRADGVDLAAILAKSFSMDPALAHERFSAAIEFLESSMSLVRNGANPRKNNRGLYVDFQLLLYLADPDIAILTREDFSKEIKRSPQISRIGSLP